jgi:hypothetical protein
LQNLKTGKEIFISQYRRVRHNDSAGLCLASEFVSPRRPEMGTQEKPVCEVINSLTVLSRKD